MRPSTTGSTEAVKVIGVAGAAVATGAEDLLVTYSLGSCLGVCLYDETHRIAGLLHAMLPLSRVDPERAESNPFLFVDIGLVALLREMLAAGGHRSGIVAWLVGAGEMMDEGGFFRIGARNYEVGARVLEKNSIEVVGESVGGTAPRTLSCRVADGLVTVKVGGMEVEL